MFPQEPGASAPAASTCPSGIGARPAPTTYAAARERIVAVLADRVNPTASRRMPSAILRLGLRGQAEYLATQEGSRLSKLERERLVDDALAELLGYELLAGLFGDPNVREVIVAGPAVVLVRRDTAGWVPTDIRFRDDAHLRDSLDRLATHADPVGAVTASVNLFDLKLPNSFRAVAVIPPEAAGQPPSVSFVRVEPNPVPGLNLDPEATTSGRLLKAAVERPRPPGLLAAATAAPGCVASPTPPARPSPLEFTPSRDKITVYCRILTDRLVTRLAQRGVYDARSIEAEDLAHLISAFVRESCEKENYDLTEADQGRLQQELVAAVRK